MDDERTQRVLEAARLVVAAVGKTFVGKVEINVRLGGEPKVKLVATTSLN